MLNDFDDCFDNYYLCGDSQQGQWIEMNIGRPLIAPVVSDGHLLVTLDNVYRCEWQEKQKLDGPSDWIGFVTLTWIWLWIEQFCSAGSTKYLISVQREETVHASV